MANTNQNVCGLKREDFQTTINGKNTDLFILKNSTGSEVAITNYGGGIVALMVPDRDGNFANVMQGYDNIQDMINTTEPYRSVLIGRWGNRINNGKFQLNGKEYQLALNDGKNHLHGGPTGLHRQVWDAFQTDDQRITLNVILPYGHEGFSGEVKITVEYTWTDDNELIIEYFATTNKKTIINLTHHAFFSLQGVATPTADILDQVLEMNCDFYLPIDETSIPTGEILKVEGTPFDFRTPKTIGQDIEAENEQLKNGSGYDHCYVCNKKEECEMSFVVRLTEPKSGRILEAYTTEPGMQLYTGNFLNGAAGIHGTTYPKRSAVCFESQHFPDSPNRPYFPSTVLKPGEKYVHKTIYKFSAK